MNSRVSMIYEADYVAEISLVTGSFDMHTFDEAQLTPRGFCLGNFKVPAEDDASMEQ
jgi:hypothetical protein